MIGGILYPHNRLPTRDHRATQDMLLDHEGKSQLSKIHGCRRMTSVAESEDPVALQHVLEQTWATKQERRFVVQDMPAAQVVTHTVPWFSCQGSVSSAASFTG